MDCGSGRQTRVGKIGVDENPVLLSDLEEVFAIQVRDHVYFGSGAGRYSQDEVQNDSVEEACGDARGSQR